jgi:predicted nucleotidyltransferase
MTPLKAFDPLAILNALHRRNVSFVVVGGVAGYLFGSNLPSANLDICFASDVENLQHLAAALVEMHAELRGDESNQVDVQALESNSVLTLKTDFGILHCIRTPPGTDGYDDLRTRAEVFDIDGVSTKVAGLQDLIRMKEVSNRPKDQSAREALRIAQRLRQNR